MRFRSLSKWVCCFALSAFLFCPAFSSENVEHEYWWTQKTMRLIQTNLREIDASLNVDTYISTIKDYNANETQSLLVKSTIDGLLNFERDVQLDNPFVQLTHYASQSNDYEWIGLINHTGQLNNSYYVPVPLLSIGITIKTDCNPKTVKLMKSGKLVNFHYNEGYLKMMLDKLDDFEMINIVYD